MTHKYPMVFLPAALVLGGCLLPGEKLCSEVGCVSGIEVVFHGPLPKYAIQIAYGADALEVTCDHGAMHSDDSTVRAVSVECRDTSFVFSDFGNKRPAQAFIRLEDGNGKVLSEGVHPLHWVGDLYPNGKECDKVPCQSATVDIPVT